MALEPEQIGQLLARLESNRNIIESDVAQLVYHLHGAISYNDAWQLSQPQRKLFVSIINKQRESADPNGRQRLI